MKGIFGGNPVVLFSLLFSVQCAFAVPNQQISFNRNIVGDQMVYEYRWFDHQDIPRHISFALDLAKLKNLPLHQSNYVPDVAMGYIKNELMKYAQTLDPRKARIEISQLKGRLSTRFRGNDPEYLNTLQSEFKQREEQAFKAYLDAHYYELFTAASGTTGVKADHIRYINTFVDVMKPAAMAFYAVYDNNATPRQYIDLVLSWSQSIPYNELKGRGDSNGAGFLPPIALLNANLGDCDSKSVLAAAMIRNFMPKAKMALLILPKHALLGIALRPLSKDMSYPTDTMPLVLMEPTGPAPLTLGQVAPGSLRQIHNGMVTLQSIP